MKNPFKTPTKSEMSSLRTMTKVTTTTVAERAYARYLARGGQDGHDQEDWLAAEQEVLAEGRLSSRVQKN